MKQINHDVTTIDEVLAKLKDLNHAWLLQESYLPGFTLAAFAASRANTLTWWFRYRDIPLARLFPRFVISESRINKSGLRMGAPTSEIPLQWRVLPSTHFGSMRNPFQSLERFHSSGETLTKP